MTEPNGRRSSPEGSANSRPHRTRSYMNQLTSFSSFSSFSSFFPFFLSVTRQTSLPTPDRFRERDTNYQLGLAPGYLSKCPSTSTSPHFPQSSPSPSPSPSSYVMATHTNTDTRPHPYSIARSYSYRYSASPVYVYETLPGASDTRPSSTSTPPAPATILPPTPSRSAPLAVRITPANRTRLSKCV